MHSFLSNCLTTAIVHCPGRPDLRRHLLLILLVVAAAGCARFEVMVSDDIRADILAALDADDYRRASRLSGGISTAHPAYDDVSALNKQIQARLKTYQQHKIAEAFELANGRRWHQAYALLDEAAANSPRSNNAIDEAREKLEQRETIYYERLEGQLLLGKAQWLAGTDPRQPRLKELTLRDADRMARELENLKRQTAARLTALGRAAGAREEWITARDLLRAAQQLAPGEKPDPVLEAAQTWLNSNASNKRKQMEATQQAEAERLVAAYRDSKALSQLLAARRYIEQHTQGNHLEQLRQEVAILCLERFDQGMREGEKRYASGDYQGALEQWRAIQPIFPNHSELEKKLGRVHRVLESLESLNAQP